MSQGKEKGAFHRGEPPRASVPLEHAEDTARIIGAAIIVHRTLGRGLREVIYQRAIAIELRRVGVAGRLEHEIEVFYRGVSVGKQRLDVLAVPLDAAGPSIVLEVKHFDPQDRVRLELARGQCATFVAAAQLRLGLVLNFGGPVLVASRVLNPNERLQS